MIDLQSQASIYLFKTAYAKTDTGNKFQYISVYCFEDFCNSLEVLPVNMRKLTNLRHLGIKGCCSLRQMPVGMGSLSCLRTLSMFIVMPKSGCGITELQGLDHLTGELKIEGLEHVRNSKDAKNANLMRKKHLRVLSLIWSERDNGTIEEEDELALIGEGLQPHPNIKRLHLVLYNGLKIPSWMSHSCLPNLIEISLDRCRRCEHLPTLGKLPLLEVLRISGMNSLKCIGDECYGDHHPQGSSFFPSLKSLGIHYMPNLEEWYSSSSSNEEVFFTSLESLDLRRCPKLRSMPRLSPTLKKLKLKMSNEMISERSLESLPPYISTLEIEGYDHEFLLHERSWAMILQKFACLQSLKISYCDKIKTLPNLPTTLTELCFFCCDQMVSLPGVMHLTSLKILDIGLCGSLKCLPELGSRNTVLTKLNIHRCYGLTSVSDCLRHLTALEDLSINVCPELEFLPDDFQDLSSLRNLRITRVPQMTCLLEGLLQQVAGTLENLEISECPGLTSLPEGIDKFTSLRSLDIADCENLTILPEEVLHLASLKTVSISNCHPDLHRRYAKETGEDWHKIAHIPLLEIIQHKKLMKRNMIPCFSSMISSGTS